MSWQLQFLIVYMCIFRSDMDFDRKKVMLEFARKDFGISKEEFRALNKMVKKEALEANVRYASYSVELLAKMAETQNQGGCE